jgi:hypothetical protein
MQSLYGIVLSVNYVGARTGSLELVVVLAALGYTYEAVSKFKDFSDSASLIGDHLRALVQGVASRVLESPGLAPRTAVTTVRMFTPADHVPTPQPEDHSISQPAALPNPTRPSASTETVTILSLTPIQRFAPYCWSPDCLYSSYSRQSSFGSSYGLPWRGRISPVQPD